MSRASEGHLITLAQGWSLWRQLCLRGAGLPLQGVLELASVPSARAADALGEQQGRVARARARALEALEGAVDRLRGEAGRSAGKALRRVRAGELPEQGVEEPEAQACLEQLREALSSCERARAQAEATFEQERLRVARVLRDQGREPLVREAIAWQNRLALRGIDSLLQRPVEAHDSRTRQNERLLANYIQRYCAKNDTIGFFGPVGWGTLAEHGGSRLRPGPALLEKRTVYFEHWALDVLAERLSELPGLRPFLPPRLSPVMRWEGELLWSPLGPSPVEPLQARLLAACDGMRTARQLALELAASSPQQAPAEDEVYAALEHMREQGWVLWRLEVPTVTQPAERALHAQLEGIEDARVREASLAPLRELESARAAVEHAAGDVQALERALALLSETFVRLTHTEASRRRGETYAGRGLVYEDCRRAGELQLGADFLERLARPLSLLLTASRWCSHHVAARYQEHLLALFRSLTSEAGTDRLDLAYFFTAAAEFFPRTGGVVPDSVKALLEDYRERWRRVLRPEPGARRIHLSARELEALWEDAFAAPGPGWPTARYHSPDVLIAAQSLEALREGQALLVLGELHTFSNTLEQELYFSEHPAPEGLRQALERDLPSGRLSPVPPKDLASRCYPTPRSEHPSDVSLEVDDAWSWRPRSQTLPISALVVFEHQGRLKVRTRDGAREWELIAALDLLLTEFNISILPDAEHTPRITIDDFVLQREAWRFEVAALPFLSAQTPLERFAAVRAWARARELPRYLFFKTSAEAKPCYLDLESPLYVENFLKLVRHSAHVGLSEMLPTPEQCWLVDGAGQRYTSELRLVAVDPQPWKST